MIANPIRVIWNGLFEMLDLKMFTLMQTSEHTIKNQEMKASLKMILN